MPAITSISATQLLQVFPFPLKRKQYSLGRTLTFYDRAGDAVFRPFQGKDMLVSDLEMRILNSCAINGKIPTRTLAERAGKTGSKPSHKPQPLTAYWVKLPNGKTRKVSQTVFSYLSYLALDGYVSHEELENAVHGQEMSISLYAKARMQMKRIGIKFNVRRNSRDRSQSGMYLGSIEDLAEYRKEHQLRRMGVTYNTFTGYVKIGNKKPKVLPERGIRMLDAILRHGQSGISRKALYEHLYEETGRSSAILANVKVQKFLTNRALGGSYIRIRGERYYFNEATK